MCPQTGPVTMSLGCQMRLLMSCHIFSATGSELWPWKLWSLEPLTTASYSGLGEGTQLGFTQLPTTDRLGNDRMQWKQLLPHLIKSA